MRVRALALVCIAACGRIGFDNRDTVGDGGGDGGCVGTACGVQCVADCFPTVVARGATLPPIHGASLAWMPSGELHVLFVDPASGAVTWQYSDPTFRNWSVPVALSDGVAGTFDSVELVRHADGSLTALVLDSEQDASLFYRQSLVPVGASAWAASGAFTVIAWPLGTVNGFDAVSDRAGLGGFIITIELGDGVTIGHTLFATRSTDKFATLEGVNGAGPWEALRTSVPPMIYYEARIAVDSADAPWIYYHERMSSNDDAALLRYVGGSWMRALPGWGDPWRAEMFVDSTDLLHAIYEQEGTQNNPQHATATSLTTISGSVSVGNWDWASAGGSAQLQLALASDGDALRVAWENPETSAVDMRTVVPTLGTLHGGLVGAVTTIGDGTTCSLVTAPELRAGTSHLMWRERGGSGEYVWLYEPATECGATLCQPDEACVAGACTAR